MPAHFPFLIGRQLAHVLHHLRHQALFPEKIGAQLTQFLAGADGGDAAFKFFLVLFDFFDHVPDTGKRGLNKKSLIPGGNQTD